MKTKKTLPKKNKLIKTESLRLVTGGDTSDSRKKSQYQLMMQKKKDE